VKPVASGGWVGGCDGLLYMPMKDKQVRAKQPRPEFFKPRVGGAPGSLSRKVTALLLKLSKTRGKLKRKLLADQIILLNEPILASYARRHVGHGLEFEDLMQEGRIGLLVAIDRFKPELGFAFLTYAIWWLRHYMRRAIDNQGRVIRMPSHQQTVYSKLLEAKARLSRSLNRPATNDELATAISHERYAPGGAKGFHGDDVERTMRVWQPPIHADPERPDAMLDWLSWDVQPHVEQELNNALDKHQLGKLLREAIKALKPREAYILRRMYHDATLNEVGQELGLTRERIRQIKVKAIRTLRQRMQRGQQQAQL